MVAAGLLVVSAAEVEVWFVVVAGFGVFEGLACGEVSERNGFRCDEDGCVDGRPVLRRERAEKEGIVDGG